MPDARPAPVIPLTAPSRAELWRRHQLAVSILNHRDLTPDTRRLVLNILNGTEHPLGGAA